MKEIKQACIHKQAMMALQEMADLNGFNVTSWCVTVFITIY